VEVTCDLYNIDAFQLLGSLADGAVDCVICDPPYSERVHAQKIGGLGASRCGKRKAIPFGPISPATIGRLVEELLRVTKRWCLCFCAVESFADYCAAAGDAYVRSGVWVKHSGLPQLSGDRPAQGTEGIAIFHRQESKRWNGDGGQNGGLGYWVYSPEKNPAELHHPTMKPLPLMMQLVAQFSDPDELVLDPFAGSGTTAVACLRSGRRFIGSEIDPKYHALALERIAAERSCSTLAQHRAGQLGLLGGEP
jgi:site-specific DNA-methyltransferase (adenine-specific)